MLCSLTVSNWSATWKRGSCLVYALVAAKGGPRLQPSKVNGSTIDSSNNKIDIRGGDNTDSTLAAELSKRLGRDGHGSCRGELMVFGHLMWEGYFPGSSEQAAGSTFDFRLGPPDRGPRPRRVYTWRKPEPEKPAPWRRLKHQKQKPRTSGLRFGAFFSGRGRLERRRET
jgi:hypothetical protein